MSRSQSKRQKTNPTIPTVPTPLPITLSLPNTIQSSQFPIVPRRERVNCLRQFVLSKYQINYLKSGPILDIAGGKGDLSWLFLNKDAILSCVVDPRRTDHCKLERQAQWCLDNPEEAAIQVLTTHQLMPTLHLRPPFQTPKHLQLFVDDALVDALLGIGNNWEQFFHAASIRAKAEEGIKGHHQPKLKDTSSTTTSSTESSSTTSSTTTTNGCITNALEAKNTLLNTKLICGFHPDEATDTSIDLALALKIPFAICPCCWFPKINRHRRITTKSGTESSVRTFLDYITFLKQKHSKIRVDQLPFRSEAKGNGAGLTRNFVVYMLPEDFIET